MKTNIHFFIISRSILFRMRNISDKSCRDNRNAHFMIKNFFSECHAVYAKTWKIYCRTRQAAENKIMRHRHIVCWIKKAKHRVRYTYFFSTATMVKQTPHSVTMHVVCLPCLASVTTDCLVFLSVTTYSDIKR